MSFLTANITFTDNTTIQPIGTFTSHFVSPMKVGPGAAPQFTFFTAPDGSDGGFSPNGLFLGVTTTPDDPISGTLYARCDKFAPGGYTMATLTYMAWGSA